MASAWAYPPNPYHLVYGLVRDEYGTPISDPTVQIVMVATNGTQNVAAVDPTLAVGVNYQLPVPMDALVKPDLYRSNALTLGVGYRMLVVVGSATNVPIISTTTITNLGQPAKMTRIDLTLGTDSNGDGIPDEWELAFLAAIGSNLSLPDLNANLDLLNDGRTLMQEFLLGSAAFDSGDPFAVRMVAYNGGSSVLEFPTTLGRSYTVFGSTNLQQWAVLPFRLSTEIVSGPTRTNFTATAMQTLQIQVLAGSPGPNMQFFRIGLQ